MDLREEQVYARIGEAGFARLVRAFYGQVPEDDILGTMYSAEELEAAERRLRDFLIGRFGGPPRYIERRGHPRLRMRHARFAIDQFARDRWVQLMDRALEHAALDADAAAVLKSFLHETATFLINRVPAPTTSPPEPVAGGRPRAGDEDEVGS
ncbi:MAG: globin domain-containing protein [Acidobacteriota bacterium]